MILLSSILCNIQIINVICIAVASNGAAAFCVMIVSDTLFFAGYAKVKSAVDTRAKQFDTILQEFWDYNV